MTAKTMWIGTTPSTCDICKGKIDKGFVDGKTIYGPWANMCLVCHKEKGCGLGMGKGQRYQQQAEGWVKTG